MAREDNHTTTVALLDGFANGDPDDVLRLGDLLKDFGPAAFGMLLFLGVLPAFIPVPGVGGAVGGPLVILVGVQLLLGMRKLWLPGFLARRGPHRSAMMRFRQRMAPWLRRLEKLVRPRMRFAMALWMRCSVRVSTLEVASSRMRMGRSARIARAMVRSCFCPWEMLVASSPSSIW